MIQLRTDENIFRLLLEHCTGRSRHQSSWRRRVLLLELVAHLLHRDKFDALVFLEMLDEPTYH